MGSYEGQRGPMGTYGGLWGPMGTYGDFFRTLVLQPFSWWLHLPNPIISSFFLRSIFAHPF